MKITIEPSKPEPRYEAVSIDTLTNEDGTSELTEAALRLLVCAGHAQCNVAEAARNWADEVEGNQ